MQGAARGGVAGRGGIAAFDVRTNSLTPDLPSLAGQERKSEEIQLRHKDRTTIVRCASHPPMLVLSSEIPLDERMHSSTLRKVGGSVMLAVPPALLDVLELEAGARVETGLEKGRLIVVPRTRPTYSLDELLAQCDKTAPADEGDRSWLEATPVGSELL